MMMKVNTLRGGPTQPEICAVSLAKLGVRNGDIAIDIGCGTGTVSIAIAKTAGHVHAIDMRSEAIVHARRRIASAGCDNITLVEGNAVDFLKHADTIDIAFIGGSKELSVILEYLAAKHVRSIVVNAVLLETAALAITEMRRLGIFSEAIHLQVSRSHDLAGKTIFKPINPVYIISGGSR